MRIGIIGAGPAGLTAAYELQRQGQDVEIFEAGGQVGGLSRTIELWDQRVDIGPHRFFTKHDRVDDFWHDAIDGRYRSVRRMTRIYYRKRFFDYPLDIGNIVRNLSPGAIGGAFLSWLWARTRRPAVDEGGGETFESWTVRHFGRRLYEMFFRSYTEKLWGIPCSRLDADFAAQRIRKFSLGGTIVAALGMGKGRHKTLVDCFDYPLEGAGAVYENIARRFEAIGGRIHLNCPVDRVDAVSGRVTGIVTGDGRIEAFDHVVSTMPLTLMARRLPGVPAPVESALDTLRYRNTILVYLKLELPDLFPDQWIYVHEPDVTVGRITNFRNWVPELYGAEAATILALEMWCYAEDALWAESDAGLIARASDELRTLKLVGDTPISAGHVIRVPRSYPVYEAGYRKAIEPVVDFVRSFDNLWPIGRYGSFKYNNQDHSIFMGLLAAENIVGGAHHDLWAINSDYDEYQEDGPVPAPPEDA